MKSGWVTKKLGEVCEIKLGKTPPRDDYSYWDRQKSSGHVWVSISDMASLSDGQIIDSKEYITNKALEEAGVPIVEKGTLLLSFKLTIGRTAIAGRDLSTNEAIAALPLKQEFAQQIDLHYLVLYFAAFDWNLFAAKDDKMLGKTLNKKRLATVSIVIPPLAEQKRIVAKIDAAFEKIDRLKANAEKNLANAKELFQSALDEAMRPKKGWVEKRLGEVCSKIGSGATPRGGKASYCADGVSLIRSMNVYDCAFEYSELAHINDIQAKELANVTIETNDVLINITGASVARCCVVPSDVLPARVNQHVAILRIADERFLNHDFLCYSLVAPSKKSLLLGIGEAGSTRQALTKADLSSFKIEIPSLSEQKRITAMVGTLKQANETLQQNYARQIADCAEMRQAILREAFEGRL